MKPNVTRPSALRIPLFWDRKGDKKHIGYYFPGTEIICTPKGRFSEQRRQNLNRSTVDPKNNAHLRRVTAAYYTKDYIYRGN